MFDPVFMNKSIRHHTCYFISFVYWPSLSISNKGQSVYCTGMFAQTAGQKPKVGQMFFDPSANCRMFEKMSDGRLTFFEKKENVLTKIEQKSIVWPIFFNESCLTH